MDYILYTPTAMAMVNANRVLSKLPRTKLTVICEQGLEARVSSELSLDTLVDCIAVEEVAFDDLVEII